MLKPEGENFFESKLEALSTSFHTSFFSSWVKEK
jgi:hypothetical protein